MLSDAVEYAGSDHKPRYVNLHLQQHAKAASPSIWLGDDDTTHGVEMTVGEAEQVAERLLALVVSAGSPRPGVVSALRTMVTQATPATVRSDTR